MNVGDNVPDKIQDELSRLGIVAQVSKGDSKLVVQLAPQFVLSAEQDLIIDGMKLAFEALDIEVEIR